MDDEVWGRPPIPPEEPKGELLTRFNGWVSSHSSSPKGFFLLNIGVSRDEFYKMARLVEIRGIQIHFEVYAAETSDDIDSDDLLKALGLED